MTDEDVWALVLANPIKLRRACRRALPSHRISELDELYSDVVIGRAVSIMRTFDPSRGFKPITHLMANVRWYARKWVHGRCYKKVPQSMTSAGILDHDEPDDGEFTEAMEARAEVGLILDGLPEEARQLLEWYVMKDYTLGEIASHFDPPVSRAQVKTMVRDALELAREIAGNQEVGETDG